MTPAINPGYLRLAVVAGLAGVAFALGDEVFRPARSTSWLVFDLALAFASNFLAFFSLGWARARWSLPERRYRVGLALSAGLGLAATIWYVWIYVSHMKWPTEAANLGVVWACPGLALFWLSYSVVAAGPWVARGFALRESESNDRSNLTPSNGDS